MKRTITAATIVFTLAGLAPVLAQPQAPETVPADVESAAPLATDETLRKVEAAITELTEQQAAAGTTSEATAPAAELAAPPVASEAPAEAAAAAIDMAEEPVPPEASSEVAAAGTGASGTDTAKAPCPMQGKGMMYRGGMGKDGKGPGGRKPGCDRCGKGQHNKHQEVVRRLDMIEARMAKIEAMLERLMQR